ncbi:DUF4269 domain-containing protein [Halobacillus litoralis]|uniref:DUF4269 domain-containing protein n=1 Tax=Halobacillus litoralis TaxID=45668 RepID=UPI001CD5EE1E|nr:DUF4269 domain-containing protein [Halobacillus litoralis]MCA0970221.1 DUF4269 domain-containing protein [Halobacillus litoralis]
MKEGSPKQKRAYQALQNLHLLYDLSCYQPVLCGTIPIGFDLEGSDLDIVLHVEDFALYEERLLKLYQNKEKFQIKRKPAALKANFFFGGFEFELYAQNQPSLLQNAYLHMIIEHKLLQEDASLKERIVYLKRTGLTTEEAFCEQLGIKGDPYTGLIRYGKARHFI